MTKTIKCRGCGVEFIYVAAGRGRPPVRCEECRENGTRGDTKRHGHSDNGETRNGDGNGDNGDNGDGDGQGQGQGDAQDGSGQSQDGQDGQGQDGDQQEAQDGQDGDGDGDGQEEDSDPKPELPDDTSNVEAMIDYAQELSEWQKRQSEKKAEEEARKAEEEKKLRDAQEKAEALKKRMAGQHKNFNLLIGYLRAGVIPYLHGPAGSGKSTAARKAAELLGLSYGWIACHPMMGDHSVFGYMSATGTYVRGAIRDIFEHGGIFLIDEIDNGNPQLLAALNGMLALNVGEVFIFPDNVAVKRHPNFKPIVAGNTAGRGADDIYVAREALDGATLNRFAYLDWPYDEVLERNLVQNKNWAARVQALRKANKAARESLVITPRATIMGESMLAEGIDQTQVEEALIWQGCETDVKAAVLARLPQ